LWPFSASQADPTATDPAAIARAKVAGYSAYEWAQFTPGLRASMLDDPSFGRPETRPLVDPQQQVTKPPEDVFWDKFLSGVKGDLRGVWQSLGALKWPVLIGAGFALVLIIKGKLK